MEETKNVESQISKMKYNLELGSRSTRRYILLKKTVFPFASSYQLPIAPQLEWTSSCPGILTCLAFIWLDVVQVLCMSSQF